MAKALGGIVLASLILSSAALATIRECIEEDGCVVVETLGNGTRIEHDVAFGDEFETSAGSSYTWRGGTTAWQTN